MIYKKSNLCVQREKARQTQREREHQREREREGEMKTESGLHVRPVPDTDMALLGKQILKKQDEGVWSLGVPDHESPPVHIAHVI